MCECEVNSVNVVCGYAIENMKRLPGAGLSGASQNGQANAGRYHGIPHRVPFFFMQRRELKVECTEVISRLTFVLPGLRRQGILLSARCCDVVAAV